MDSTNIRTAPELAQELNSANDKTSFSKAILDTCNAHDESSHADWTQMNQTLRESVSLKQLGLGDFVLTGTDTSHPSDPEITLSKPDGSEPIAVDSQGIITVGSLFPAAATDATAAPVTVAAVPTDSTVAPASATAAPTDATAAPSTSGDGTIAEDPATGVAPDGSFGPNGRKMVLNSDSTQGVYTVQPGDSLWTIAEDKLSVGDASSDPDFQTNVANLVAQLTSDNNISDPDLIYPGQTITFTNLQNSAYDTSTALQSVTGAAPTNGQDATSVTSSDFTAGVPLPAASTSDADLAPLVSSSSTAVDSDPTQTNIDTDTGTDPGS
jgi:LysM repeat protein